MIDDENDEYAPYTGIGRPPLELLLLALIDGHEYTGEKNRRQRLDQALLAISGNKAAPGPLSNDPYERGCLLMAEAEYKDDVAITDFQIRKKLGKPLPNDPPKKRSVLELAEIAEKEVFQSGNAELQHSNVQRLRETYAGSYQKKLKGRDRVDHRASYLYQVKEQDFVAESLERQILDRIATEMKRLGVPFSLK